MNKTHVIAQAACDRCGTSILADSTLATQINHVDALSSQHMELIQNFHNKF